MPEQKGSFTFDYGLRVLRVILSHPAEAIDRIRGRFEMAKEGLRDPERMEIASDREWDRHVHGALGQPWPCDQTARFLSIWQELSQSIDGVMPLGTGHDADAAFARALWCLVRHLKPTRIVETGVARGIGTRFILEALEANGHGQLWSIDLPPMVSGWHDVSTAAIPARLRSRWTFLRGSSRRRLPALLRDISEIDLFVHDSLHTAANMRFEFASAWAALRPSGILISDDVSANRSFSDFVSNRQAPFIVAQEDSKPSAFGIAFRSASTGSLPGVSDARENIEHRS
jgi:predicted O-methyltransferase YrrM